MNAPQLRNNTLLLLFVSRCRPRILAILFQVNFVDQPVDDELSEKVVFIAHHHSVRLHTDGSIAAEPIHDHPPQRVVDLVKRDALTFHGRKVCDQEHHKTLIVAI